MKNRKVLQLRTHIAGILSVNSYDHKLHKAEMELTPVGVFVRVFKEKPTSVLVPFANIIEVVLAPEEEEKTKKAP